jgi:cytidyltransferase-like protein
MKTVLIAGYFDPLHEGHLDHIEKAAHLGDYLIVVTHSDECTERVKTLRLTNEGFRRFVLDAVLNRLGIVGKVYLTDSEDVSNIIRKMRPNIFAKGGDRTESNMPQAEIEACEEVGCQIIYGVGDQLNSSSRIKKALEAKCQK